METALENRKKRLIMRAEHRGMKEMDIILGRFVRKHVEAWSEAQVIAIETMMDENDQALYAMICGHEEIPEEFNDLMTQIKTFVNNGY